ncbi:NADPH-dependent 7-cyano-7-deazaguanine reductase QueF [Flavobacterium sp. MXW15]|uniref:NADPH-dependent 7-cyano-7-deazaguanine reductase n=1 Tax=Xanthomonas chitinilytica TaxID=2989819 RepID=A0ABT3JYS4_9XANT|nr:NADPH-dependent 7-cyano-7-deazaguanine reductase QueF [Xanthomonas sp. H13-6]MCW4456045.1 NADPH-dependent 7-cyano-7-deazaguanine reductase QueF [Flavobacterium sp. MXW15]MCW4473642.1 NADPH-dependent 7-cyano-7-deazaguanine reductase QueF [Xanthomonas sp. H13-6]
MNTPQDSSLGREVAYPSQYDPGLLFPIPRAGARAEIGIDDAGLPFIGHDRWHAYELGWLDARGKPCVATATLLVPCDSPNLIESKSLKLYLNSLNAERFNSAEAVRERIAVDLSVRAGADVLVEFGLPPVDAVGEGENIDLLDVDIDCYGPPQARFLAVDETVEADETLASALLKSNCPVTGQPDWAGVVIRYRGPRIDREGLLRYLVSYRDHAEFHEQCVERIFLDLMRHCRPQSLQVEARYTRRGGLDINPWRASADVAGVVPALRDVRQ